MTYFDVFNGDADGICALQQWRLAHPRETTLVSGVKRDIKLLSQVDAASDDVVTVFDISLDKNREDLTRLLDNGVSVAYFDHHYAGDIPRHPRLEAIIDTAPVTCTSLIVDQYLEGVHRAWAVVGAFGDNFAASARDAAASLRLAARELEELEQLGICLNYNGYGATLDDLFFHPDALYRAVQPYTNPLDFIRESQEFATLSAGYEQDMAKARALKPEILTECHALFVLPSDKWARRASGVYANELASAAPNRAHAMLTALPGGGFVVSVRAPQSDPQGADTLCRAFPTGGGRKAAAGINLLPADAFEQFVNAFTRAYP